MSEDFVTGNPRYIEDDEPLTENQIQTQAENRAQEAYEHQQELINPRYVDPPVVHLEQVIWCSNHYPKKVEAVAIKKGDSLCEECFYNRP